VKLVILGRGPNWERAAAEKPDQFWVISTAYNLARAVGITPDRVFQLHDKSLFEPWLSEVEDRLFLIEKDVDFPRAAVVPVESLVAKYGPRFASTFVWMMAMALEEGFDEIIIHGVHLAHETEYGMQRDTYFYFQGRAEARGVRVTVPADSGIFIGNHLYGVKP
jgi:hypothetical protein